MHGNEVREKWLPTSGTHVKSFGHGSNSIRTSRPMQITIIFIIFVTGLVCTWKVVLKDNPVQEAMLVRSQNGSSSSCSRIHSYPTTTDRERCYPLLINFGHQCCRLAQRNNCLTSLRHGIQQCLMLNKKILDADPGFINRNKNILDRQRGAGYWLWKPYIILQELYLARDGDIIVYSDAAVNFTNDISHLTKLTSKQDIVIFELADWKESMFTKRDALIILDADKAEYTKTQAGIASYLVVKRSFTSLRFISEWLTYAQDHRVITDDENELGSSNYPDFRAHRHDQSILSLLAKKWNLKLYPDPSQWGEKVNRPYPTIFNHHRSKN